MRPGPRACAGPRLGPEACWVRTRPTGKSGALAGHQVAISTGGSDPKQPSLQLLLWIFQPASRRSVKAPSGRSFRAGQHHTEQRDSNAAPTPLPRTDLWAGAPPAGAPLGSPKAAGPPALWGCELHNGCYLRARPRLRGPTNK